MTHNSRKKGHGPGGRSLRRDLAGRAPEPDGPHRRYATAALHHGSTCCTAALLYGRKPLRLRLWPPAPAAANLRMSSGSSHINQTMVRPRSGRGEGEKHGPPRQRRSCADVRAAHGLQGGPSAAPEARSSSVCTSPPAPRNRPRSIWKPRDLAYWDASAHEWR